MKTVAIAVACAIVAAPATASIDHWTFMGTGTVTVATGPWAPALGSPDSFSGQIVPFGFPPANSSSGTIASINDAVTYWDVIDSYVTFTIDNSGYAPIGSYTWTNGGLTDFNLQNGDPSISGYLHLSKYFFEGYLFDLIDPTNDSYYKGVNTFVSTTAYRIGADGHITPETIVLLNRVPEPSTWAMLIAGFGLTGAAMRARGRVAARR